MNGQYKHHFSEILNDPNFNKDTGFTLEERKKLRIRGLLPPNVETIEQQVKRCLFQVRKFEDDLNKWIYLSSLATRNTNLFYRVVIENLVEMMPIVYTPTVGRACTEFSHESRNCQGIFLSLENDKGQISEILENWELEPDIIVVTDGSRILGLGLDFFSFKI
jgi:malate dehydrogenase (oxaloacetate-decarboxylating)(NADP+)